MIKNFIPHSGQALWLVDWNEGKHGYREVMPIVGWDLREGVLYPVAVPPDGRPRLVLADKVTIYSDYEQGERDANAEFE